MTVTITGLTGLSQWHIAMNEIEAWLREQSISYRHVRDGTDDIFTFTDPKDATLFKLFWEGRG